MLGQGEIILIIDDDECIRDSCRQALTKAGYCVETAMDGEVGLTKAKEMEPDMALVDLQLPGMSGLSVMDKLDEISPGSIKIVITGDTSVDLETEVIEKRGALGFLCKPFSPDELNLVVRKAFDAREQSKT